MTTAPTDVATPSPEPSAAPPAPASPVAALEGASPSPEPKMMSIPIDQLPAQYRTGDFHRLVHAAKSYQQVEESGILDVEKAIRDSGYDPQSFLAFLNESDDTDPQPARAPAVQPPDPNADPTRPMTMADFQAWQESQKAETQAERDAQAEVDVQRAEDAAARDVLGRVGITLAADGKLNSPKEKIWFGHWLTTLNQTRRESAYPGLPASEVSKRIKTTPPSLSEVATATERFMAEYADATNQTIADFASGQDDVPSATLGTGPGGAGTDAPMNEKDWDQLGPGGQRKLLESRMAAKVPQRLGG